MISERFETLSKFFLLPLPDLQTTSRFIYRRCAIINEIDTPYECVHVRERERERKKASEKVYTQQVVKSFYYKTVGGECHHNNRFEREEKERERGRKK